MLGLTRQIDFYHAYDENPYNIEHGKLADIAQRAGKRGKAVAYADDEIQHGGDGAEEDAARHPLAIEHQTEGTIHEGRARLLLHDDEHEGNQDDDGRPQEVLPFVEREAILIDELCKDQRCGTLRKLGRLQTDGAEGEP